MEEVLLQWERRKSAHRKKNRDMERQLCHYDSFQANLVVVGIIFNCTTQTVYVCILYVYVCHTIASLCGITFFPLNGRDGYVNQNG